MIGPSPEMAATLTEDEKERFRKMTEIRPVNIKTLNGVDWEKLQGNIKKLTSFKDMEPKYVVP